MFYGYSSGGGNVHHVAIYVGDDHVIYVPDLGTVMTVPLGGPGPALGFGRPACGP